MRTMALGMVAVAAGALLSAGTPSRAQGPEYDLWFIDNMIPHHQGALDMAADALKKAKRPELKSFAQQVIRDQQAEITQMKNWREAWYKGAPSAKSEHIPGMQMMHGTGHGGYSKPASPTYDAEWVDEMIAHHEGAIEMSQDAPQKAKHPEIKTLAAQITRAQTAEIEQMKKWKAQWQKP